jgi:hypothetical protein
MTLILPQMQFRESSLKRTQFAVSRSDQRLSPRAQLAASPSSRDVEDKLGTPAKIPTTVSFDREARAALNHSKTADILVAILQTCPYANSADVHCEHAAVAYRKSSFCPGSRAVADYRTAPLTYFVRMSPADGTHTADFVII